MEQYNGFTLRYFNEKEIMIYGFKGTVIMRDGAQYFVPYTLLGAKSFIDFIVRNYET